MAHQQGEAPNWMGNRGDHILIGFLKAFYGQDKLFGSFENEFKYTDNREEHSLIIEPAGAYDLETTGSVPAIVVYSAGFTEQFDTMGRRDWFTFGNKDSQLTNYEHHYMIHCLARQRGTSKLLQSTTTKAIGGFRGAIFQMGADFVHPIQAQAPQKLNSPTEKPGPYSCAVNIQMRMRQTWIRDRYGDPEEAVRVKMMEALDEIELDEDGNPKNPEKVMEDTLDISH